MILVELSKYLTRFAMKTIKAYFCQLVPFALFILLIIFFAVTSEYSKDHRHYLSIGQSTIYNPYAIIPLALSFFFLGAAFPEKSVRYKGFNSIIVTLVLITFGVNMIVAIALQGYFVAIFITLLSAMFAVIGYHIKNRCEKIAYLRMVNFIWLSLFAMIPNIFVFIII